MKKTNSKMSVIAKCLTTAILTGMMSVAAFAAPADLYTSNPLQEVGRQVENMKQDAVQKEILDTFAGEMDLTGVWQDEISQRASMEITENPDGSCHVLIFWGAGATEAATWEIDGNYDPASGMLSYEDGIYKVHTWDENENEVITETARTRGALMKEGEKLRWQDSKLTQNGLFVKVSE